MPRIETFQVDDTYSDSARRCVDLVRRHVPRLLAAQRDTVQTHSDLEVFKGHASKVAPDYVWWTAEQVAKLRQLRAAGETWAAIGKALGRTADACRRRHSDRARSEPKSKKAAQ